MERRLKLALVLAGGGAKAAYQVGVVRALSALPIEFVAISAVGAGALNGAVLASNSSPAIGAAKLYQLWQETLLSKESAVQLGPIPVMQLGVYLTLLFAGGVRPQIEEKLRDTVHKTRGIRIGLSPERHASRGADLIDFAMLAAENLVNVTTDTELDQFVSEVFKQTALEPKIPFYVSVYQVEEGPLAILKIGLELAGLAASGRPRFIKINDSQLRPVERLNAVLASATLPFICEAAEIRGARFIDGSFGGMRCSPGAVPLQPLRRDSSIKPDAIMVVHTESGVAWNAGEFRDLKIIEVRPSRSSEQADVGYFWSDKGALDRWIDLGSSDCTEIMRRWLSTTQVWSEGAQAHTKLIAAAKELED